MVETDPQIRFPTGDIQYADGHAAFAGSETGKTVRDTGFPMFCVGKSIQYVETPMFYIEFLKYYIEIPMYYVGFPMYYVGRRMYRAGMSGYDAAEAETDMASATRPGRPGRKGLIRSGEAFILFPVPPSQSQTARRCPPASRRAPDSLLRTRCPAVACGGIGRAIRFRRIRGGACRR